MRSPRPRVIGRRAAAQRNWLSPGSLERARRRCGDCWTRARSTAGLSIESAVAEAQVSFDDYPGGKRNHDLLIRGRCASGAIVIGLEAKADESFGRRSQRTTACSPASRGESVDGCPGTSHSATRRHWSDVAGESSFGDLRYELFSGIAGTLPLSSPMTSPRSSFTSSRPD